jgi:predicted nucleic acid-binding protein
MRGELLLDTGALVSLLDRSQTHHLKCRRAFADWTGPVVSTEAVLTEATHLLAGVRGGRAACVDFFLSGGALLVPSSTASLQRVRKLLDKYADLPISMPICRWTLRMPRSSRWPRSSIARPCSRRIARIFRSTESKAGSPFVSCRATESSRTVARHSRTVS